jgi:hypothetical protein
MTRSLLVPLLLTALTGCGAHHLEEDVGFEQALPEGLVTLEVRVPLGSVSVHAGETGRLRLVGRSRRAAPNSEQLERLAAVDFRPSLAATDRPGVFRLSVPDLPEGVDPAEAAMILRAELYLPRGIGVDLEVDRGHVSAIGRDAPVRLHTGSGDVQLEDVEGRVEVFTGLGKVILHAVRGAVDCESGGGAILAYVERIGPGASRLKTAGPSITLHLPAAADFELEARVVHSNEGKVGVRNSFGVPVVAEGAGHVARGTVGAGGPKVVVEAAGGWISVPKIDSD